MEFFDWYKQALRKYIDFEGRAGRKEYWMFFLMNWLFIWLLGQVGSAVSALAILGSIYSLILLIPTLAIGVRRLHDTNKSGWWMLIGLIPLAGWLVLLVFMLEKGTAGPNRFGNMPSDMPDGSGWSPDPSRRRENNRSDMRVIDPVEDEIIFRNEMESEPEIEEKEFDMPSDDVFL